MLTTMSLHFNTKFSYVKRFDEHILPFLFATCLTPETPFFFDTPVLRHIDRILKRNACMIIHFFRECCQGRDFAWLKVGRVRRPRIYYIMFALLDLEVYVV